MDRYNDIDPRDTHAIQEAKDKAHRANLIKFENESALYKLLLSPEGEKLVQHWVDTYVMGMIALPGDTNVQIGIRQGQANFVMHIKHILDQLNKGVENG